MRSRRRRRRRRHRPRRRVARRGREANGELRPCRPGDITVLLPARTSLPALEAALRERGVPYRAENSSVVYTTAEIRHLMLALRAADDPTDELALVAALRSPLYGCSDVELYEWATGGGRWNIWAPPPEALADHPVAEAHRPRPLDRRRGSRGGRPPTCWPRSSTSVACSTSRSTAPTPHDVWRRVRYVIDQARAWGDVGGHGVRRYLSWARLQASEGRIADTILPEHDHDAVRIMTIHAAKGLEFPITVVSGSPPSRSAARRRRGVANRDVDARRPRRRRRLRRVQTDRRADERRRAAPAALRRVHPCRSTTSSSRCTAAANSPISRASTRAPSCWHPPARPTRRPAHASWCRRRTAHAAAAGRRRASVGGRGGVGRRTRDHARPGLGANDDQRHPVGRGPGRDRGPGRSRTAQGSRRPRPPAVATRSLRHGRRSGRARRAAVRRPRTRHRHRPPRRRAVRGRGHPRRVGDGRRPRPLGAGGADRARHARARTPPRAVRRRRDRRPRARGVHRPVRPHARRSRHRRLQDRPVDRHGHARPSVSRVTAGNSPRTASRSSGCSANRWSAAC